MESDEYYMGLALQAAREAQEAGEVPVGAVLVKDGAVLAAAGNTTRTQTDPAGHAEINVLRAGAQALGNYRLTGCTLFVSLEPCAMCAGAISHARIERLVIGASDPKGGAVWHGSRFFETDICHWRPHVDEGPLASEASALLKAFFKARRAR